MLRPYDPDHKPPQVTLPEPSINCGPIAESEKDYFRAANKKSRDEKGNSMSKPIEEAM